MTNKVKKISVNALEKSITQKPEVVNIEWNGLDITIKTRLSFEEMMEFVDSVAKSCFTSDSNSFIPEAKDFIIGCYAIELYSNITMPQNINKKYDIIIGSDLVDVILNKVDKRQFEGIIKSINEKLEYLIEKEMNIATMQTNQLLDALSGISAKAEGLFANVNSEDIQAILSAVENSKIDEAKLMKAYLDNKNNGE